MVPARNTPQKMKFSIKDLFTFTKEILNRKLHFYVQVNKVKGNFISQSLRKHNVSSSSPSSSHSAPIKVNYSSITENHDEFKPKPLDLRCTIYDNYQS